MAAASQSDSAGMPLSSYTPPLARSDTDTRPITSSTSLLVFRFIDVILVVGAALGLLAELLQDLEDLAVGLGRLVLGLLLAGVADQGAQLLHVQVRMLRQQL